MSIKDSGFRNRMMMLALLPATLVALLLACIYVGWNSGEVENALKDRERSLARQIGTAAEYGIFSGGRDTLRALAEAAQKDDPDILGVTIFGEHGEVLARAGDNSHSVVTPGMRESLTELSDRFVLVMPINRTVLPIDDLYGAGDVNTGAHISGYVVLEVSRARLIETRNTQILIGFDIAIGGLALGVWLALRMARGITEPLAHIADVVDRIGRGELTARVIDDGRHTLEMLGNDINAMAERVTLVQSELQEKISQATEELRERKEAAEVLARTDMLTSLPNRRAFMLAAEQEVLRAQRYGTSLSIALLDLDHFKTINDSYGHAAGDRVLVNRALLLVESMREVDLVARIGGEEFAILMPDTPLDEAVQAMERVRQSFGHNLVGEQAIYCTASFGVAEYPGDDPTVDGLLAKADAALYVAKANGRNRVEAAEKTVR